MNARLEICAAMLLACLHIVAGTGDPILLVPGIAGSQLDVRHSGFTFCNTLGTTPLWFTEVRLLIFGCFEDEMTLAYDRNGDQYSSGDDDIDVNVPGFGDTDTVEDLGQVFVRIDYFHDLVEYFVDRGYERGKDIRAAPYDWRLAPDELQRRGYYDNMRSLIETMYRENGNTKVTIVAHSMGGPVTLHFLTSGIVSQAWKDQYIGNFVPISGAWSGGNLALAADISGIQDIPGDIFDNIQDLASDFVDLLTPIMRSFQSIFFLMPRPSVWQDTVLVTTPTQTYTANDYERLFEDIGLTNGYAMFQGIADINEGFPAPNVPTHCFYGVGVNTPETFRYGESFPNGASNDPVEVTMGDGDGTVNTRSSEVCLQWANSGSPFSTKTFDGVGHFRIVQNAAVLSEIGKIVGAPEEATRERPWWERLFG